jgi:SH3-like domain-containing protein
MNDTIKRKKGRPKGSNSFTSVTLAELNARFGPNEVIPVGRLFLEKGVIKTSPQEARPVQPVAQPEGPKIEMFLSE